MRIELLPHRRALTPVYPDLSIEAPALVFWESGVDDARARTHEIRPYD
jgi:hypothetical protein